MMKKVSFDGLSLDMMMFLVYQLKEDTKAIQNVLDAFDRRRGWEHFGYSSMEEMIKTGPPYRSRSMIVEPEPQEPDAPWLGDDLCLICFHDFDLRVWHCPGCDHHLNPEFLTTCKYCQNFLHPPEGPRLGTMVLLLSRRMRRNSRHGAWSLLR